MSLCLLGKIVWLAHTDHWGRHLHQGRQDQRPVQRGQPGLDTEGGFTPCFRPNPNIYHFQIKYVQISDGGIYECQISVPTGTLSKKVILDVYRPESFIVVGNNTGASYEFHVNHGSPVILTCTIPMGKHNQSPQ